MYASMIYFTSLHPSYDIPSLLYFVFFSWWCEMKGREKPASAFMRAFACNPVIFTTFTSQSHSRTLLVFLYLLYVTSN